MPAPYNQLNLTALAAATEHGARAIAHLGVSVSDPSKYVQSYDFSQFQGVNPSTPLPGTQVDIQLADIQLSIEEIVEAIKDVRRSDGALKNGIVTSDSLAPGLLASIILGIGDAASSAAAISFEPAGNIASASVQAAIEELDAEKQAANANLDAWAGVAPSVNGQSLVSAANYAAMRALLDLEVGTDFLSPAAIAAAYQPLAANLTTWAGVAPSANGQSLVAAVNYAAMRALLDLEAGTDFLSPAAIAAAFQPLDADLTTIAGLARARGDLMRGGAAAWERYALGIAGYALKSDGTDAVWAPSREVLTAAHTYYVRSDGSDSNSGLVNNSGGAWLTLQKAVDVISGSLDLGIYDVTVQISDATYNGQVVLKPLTTGGGAVVFQGNTGTPANVVINHTGNTITANGPLSGSYEFNGVKGTSGGSFVSISFPCLLKFRNFTLGACTNRGFDMSFGAQVFFESNWTIDGNTPNWILRATTAACIFTATRTLTHSGTRTYTSGFAQATEGGMIHAYSMTIVGSFTGKNYDISHGGGMTLGGGGTTYFGGGTAGTINTTGGTAGWKT